MNWSVTSKEIISYGLAIFSVVFGFSLTVAGFCVEPVGEIHGTVISVLGIALSFAGAILGISLHMKNEFNSMKQHIDNRIDRRINKEIKDLEQNIDKS